MASSVPAPLEVKNGDIYLIFDKENPDLLKAMGKMNDAKQMADPIKEVSGEVNKIKTNQKLKQRISSNLNRKFETGYSVIVKLQHNSNFLYIPGFVVGIQMGTGQNGSNLYKIGVAKDKTITGVQQNQIARNDALEPANPLNNEGWFFSDVVLGSLLDGNNTELEYQQYAEKMEEIIRNTDGVRKITVQSLTSSPDAKKKASETSPPTSPDQDSYQLTDKITLNNNEIEQVKMKSVVPLIFNAAELADPEKIVPSSATTVFGGKKSRKQNTRKNTMPLQFAPGAKRSYLKRRKSSRK